ncbi:hypothetical protein RFI_20254 [Reticulomyxa filosa]|uniref:Uncharacterized protein n=1 Tax=Reticulomyxa filosa TaxID=46433 RepID=X6MTA8_RETFI|nr:hypothetical protein RFI_20254 [Reticulomyxa filosa]|eukprot:ETO17079.1 hypothetical protein RFI_20254 [Reticulomyxa filosa]
MHVKVQNLAYEYYEKNNINHLQIRITFYGIRCNCITILRENPLNVPWLRKGNRPKCEYLEKKGFHEITEPAVACILLIFLVLSQKKIKYVHISKQNTKNKHIIIQPSGNEKVIFAAIDLDETGKMPEASKKANWRELLRVIKEKLHLIDESSFILVKENNTSDQINDENELMNLWNQLNHYKKFYTLQMVCENLLKRKNH